MYYMLEQITVKPGLLRDYVDGFHADYAASAERHGFKLEASWTSPPIELIDEPNDFIALFSFADAEGFWKARRSLRSEPAPYGWWEKSASMQLSRTRKFLAPASTSALSK